MLVPNLVSVQPGDCSPSRSVVSKMRTCRSMSEGQVAKTGTQAAAAPSGSSATAHQGMKGCVPWYARTPPGAPVWMENRP